MKGLVIVHDLPPSDQEAVTLSKTNEWGQVCPHRVTQWYAERQLPSEVTMDTFTCLCVSCGHHLCV